MTPKPRIDFIDIAKGFAIILVLLGHTVSENTVTKQILYAFHMPCFFILSGFFMSFQATGNEALKEQAKRLIKKKASSLLSPYFLWAILYTFFSFKNIAYIAYGSRETLVMARTLTSLWFLPVLFSALCLNFFFSVIIDKIQANKLFLDLLTFFVFLSTGLLLPHPQPYGLPFAIDVAFVAAAFMKIGQIFKSTIIKTVQKNFHIRTAIVVILSLLIFSIFAPLTGDSERGYVLMANGLYGNGIYFLLASISGSMFLIFSSSVFSNILDILKATRIKKFFLFVGVNTMGLFLIHKPFVELGRSIVLRIHLDYNGLPIACIITTAALLCSIVAILVIQKLFPTLLGEQRK